MTHRIQLGITGLLLFLFGSMGRAQAQDIVTADVLLSNQQTPFPIATVSPDGRFAIAETYGPGSSQNNIHLFDLTGKRSLQTLSYAREPVFIEGGRALLYWSYDLTGRAGLYRLPLPEGTAYRVYPKTNREEENGSANGSGSTIWNARTGEALFVHRAADGKSTSYAFRLRDGRLRQLGVGEGAPHLSPNGALSVSAGERRYREMAFGNMLRVRTTHGKSLAVLTGRLLGWLPNSRDLLLIRGGSLVQMPYGYDHSQMLQRLDTRTGRLTRLTETTPRAVLRQNRSGSWVGVLEEHRLRLIRSADGATLPLPQTNVDGFAWGHTDTELYLQQGGIWHRLTLRLDPAVASPPSAAVPAPDRIMLPPPQTHPFAWQPLPEPDPRWRIYTNTGAIRAMAPINGSLLVGTTGGLRTLALTGRERSSDAWTSALYASEISALVTKGETLYLGAHRGMAQGSEEDVLVRLDRRTGRLQQMSLGYGDQYRRLTNLIPLGTQLLGLTERGGGLTLWDETAQTVALWNSSEQALLRGTYTVIPGRKGTVWLGTAAGLLRWKPGQLTAESWTEKHGMAANPALSLAETGNNLWIGTLGGLSLLNEKTGRITRTVGPEALHTTPITELLTTPHTLYVVTPEALFARRTATGTWRRLPLPAGGRSQFYLVQNRLFASGDATSPLCKLSNAGVWQIAASASSRRLPDNQVRTLYGLHNTLWCGTESHLARYDIAHDTFRSYPLPPGSGGIVSITSDSSSVWVSLWKGGVLQIDLKTGQAHRRLTQFLTEGWTAPETPNLLAVVPHPDYLYGIAYQGLLRFDRKTGQTRRLSLRDLTPAGGYGATYLMQATKSRLWVAAEGAPASRLIEITLPDLKVTSLPWSGELPDVSAPEPGRGFWTRQRGEIVLMDFQGALLAHYPLPAEPKSYAVKGLIRTGDGAIWFAIDSNVYHLDPNTGLYRRYISPLPHVESLAILSGALWVATSHGLARLPLPPEEAH